MPDGGRARNRNVSLKLLSERMRFSTASSTGRRAHRTTVGAPASNAFDNRQNSDTPSCVALIRHAAPCPAHGTGTISLAVWKQLPLHKHETDSSRLITSFAGTAKPHIRFWLADDSVMRVPLPDLGRRPVDRFASRPTRP